MFLWEQVQLLTAIASLVKGAPKRGLPDCSSPSPKTPKNEIQNTDFVDVMISDV
jgi:hypothetical protein